MSKLLSALFAMAMLGTTYGVYAGDGACNHAKKDVKAAVETDRMQLASGYPESGANATGADDMTDTGNTRSGTNDATTGNRSGTGASGGTGSTDAGAGTDATDATTSGSTATDNSPTGSGTSGSGTTAGDM